jgi:hypothetical protein
MVAFVRKNIVVCTVTFTALDGTMLQPSSANLVLSYKNQAGAVQSANLPMIYNSVTGAWSVNWYSSATGCGTVFWMAYGYGLLQAAAEGSFDVQANAANTI